MGSPTDHDKDGGPAFPTRAEQPPGAHGMSLRDYFAGKALVGLIVNGETVTAHAPLSARAYEIADAMLAERERRHG